MYFFLSFFYSELPIAFRFLGKFDEANKSLGMLVMLFIVFSSNHDCSGIFKYFAIAKEM